MQETPADPWVGKIPWRRKWQPTAVFLPGKSHGQRTLLGDSPWSHKLNSSSNEVLGKIQHLCSPVFLKPLVSRKDRCRKYTWYLKQNTCSAIICCYLAFISSLEWQGFYTWGRLEGSFPCLKWSLYCVLLSDFWEFFLGLFFLNVDHF